MSISYEKFYNDEEKTCYCAHCGEKLEDGDRIVYDDCTDDYYHENCFDENYSCCERCGEVVDNDYLNAAYNERGYEVYVCDDCLDCYFTRCDDCGNYYESTDETHDGRQICEDCAERNYYECSDCGLLIHANDVECIGDEYYCPDCAENHGGGYINDYSYKPIPVFYGDKEALHMGVELEIDEGDNMSDFCESVQDVEEIYLKHDGSLNDGVEIVSHPCTLEYHHNNMWEEIIDNALDCGFKSHDAGTCGLHIHLSRDYFGDDQLTSDFNIAKLVLIVNRFWDSHLLKFSRRTESQLEQWAKNTPLKAMKDDCPEIIQDKLREKSREGRYVNVNLLNAHTVELRFFRGTLKKQTFYAALELTQVLADIAIKTELNCIDTLMWDDLLSMARDRSYDNLLNYCAERGVGADKRPPATVVQLPPSTTTNTSYRPAPPELKIGDVVRIGICNVENAYRIPDAWRGLSGQYGNVVEITGNDYYRVSVIGIRDYILNARYDFDIIAPRQLQKITEKHGYYVDENNNKWNVSFYTMEQAETMSYRLNGCTDCTDCAGCTGCTGCKNCTNCTDCAGCTGCTNCRYCTDCTNCRYCTNCRNCTNCRYCTNCTGCTNCTDCMDCKNCTNCTDCADCTNCRYCTNCRNCTDCANKSN